MNEALYQCWCVCVCVRVCVYVCVVCAFVYVSERVCKLWVHYASVILTRNEIEGNGNNIDNIIAFNFIAILITCSMTFNIRILLPNTTYRLSSSWKLPRSPPSSPPCTSQTSSRSPPQSLSPPGTEPRGRSYPGHTPFLGRGGGGKGRGGMHTRSYIHV